MTLLQQKLDMAWGMGKEIVDLLRDIKRELKLHREERERSSSSD
jgi:hypothetical protein